MSSTNAINANGSSNNNNNNNNVNNNNAINPTGGGRFDFDDGGTYCGGWEDGKAHGHGICTGPKGQGEYSGAWHYGFEVSGVYTWPSGNTYSGQWQNGKRHGIGIELRGRWIYKGEWTQGYKGRYGVRQSSNSNSKYEGTWANGLQDGYGIETYADSGIYQGQWLRGMRHGYGIRKSAPYSVAAKFRSRSHAHASLTSLRSEQGEDVDKDKCKPEDNNKGGFVLRARSEPPARRRSLSEKSMAVRRTILQGLRITKQRSTGDIDNRIITAGSIRSSGSTGSCASDESRGTKHSGGIGGGAEVVDEFVDPNAVETYAGEWKNDKRTGFGMSERSDGLKYEGEWFNNKKYGYGLTTFKDGRREEGKYKNNVLVTSQKCRGMIFIRGSRLKERVEAAAQSAARASAIAAQKAEIAISRASTAVDRSMQSEVASQQANEDCQLARISSSTFAPDFFQPGLVKKQPPYELVGNHVDPSAAAMPLNSMLAQAAAAAAAAGVTTDSTSELNGSQEPLLFGGGGSGSSAAFGPASSSTIITSSNFIPVTATTSNGGNGSSSIVKTPHSSSSGHPPPHHSVVFADLSAPVTSPRTLPTVSEDFRTADQAARVTAGSSMTSSYTEEKPWAYINSQQQQQFNAGPPTNPPFAFPYYQPPLGAPPFYGPSPPHLPSSSMPPLVPHLPPNFQFNPGLSAAAAAANHHLNIVPPTPPSSSANFNKSTNDDLLYAMHLASQKLYLQQMNQYYHQQMRLRKQQQQQQQQYQRVYDSSADVFHSASASLVASRRQSSEESVPSPVKRPAYSQNARTARPGQQTTSPMDSFSNRQISTDREMSDSTAGSRMSLNQIVYDYFDQYSTRSPLSAASTGLARSRAERYKKRAKNNTARDYLDYSGSSGEDMVGAASPSSSSKVFRRSTLATPTVEKEDAGVDHGDYALRLQAALECSGGVSNLRHYYGNAGAQSPPAGPRHKPPIPLRQYTVDDYLRSSASADTSSLPNLLRLNSLSDGGGGDQRSGDNYNNNNYIPVGLSREEMARLCSQRRQELQRVNEEAELLRSNPLRALRYLYHPAVRAWLSRWKLPLLVILMNVCLTALFYKLVTYPKNSEHGNSGGKNNHQAPPSLADAEDDL